MKFSPPTISIEIDIIMSPKRCKDKKSSVQLAKVVEFLKIIAEENRLKILCVLCEGEKCVCEIWQNLELPQNLTSHHLKVLKDFNLISSRKEGLNIFYRINKKVIKKYLSLLSNFLNLRKE